MRQVSPRLSSTPACVPAQVDAHVTVSSHLLLSPCESLARPPREQAPRPGKTSLREQWREAHEESPPQRASRRPPNNACSGRCRAMSMREAGIARTGHTRLPTAARGARLPANQGSLVWGNHMMVLTKPLQSFTSWLVAASRAVGKNRGSCGVAFKPSAPAKKRGALSSAARRCGGDSRRASVESR